MEEDPVRELAAKAGAVTFRTTFRSVPSVDISGVPASRHFCSCFVCRQRRAWQSKQAHLSRAEVFKHQKAMRQRRYSPRCISHRVDEGGYVRWRRTWDRSRTWGGLRILSEPEVGIRVLRIVLCAVCCHLQENKRMGVCVCDGRTDGRTNISASNASLYRENISATDSRCSAFVASWKRRSHTLERTWPALTTLTRPVRSLTNCKC
ncbi:hypothetical protein BDN67DRAFT_528688 [Paxillus ammoniavirescens]|nr:hypothetical protein BDN67DRAFT_528688 [Paxillus ammoniavirescens]